MLLCFVFCDTIVTVILLFVYRLHVIHARGVCTVYLVPKSTVYFRRGEEAIRTNLIKTTTTDEGKWQLQRKLHHHTHTHITVTTINQQGDHQYSIPNQK